jgi:hypothetical protein
MSAETSQLVELLGISQATAWPPSTDEVVIITVRPNPDSFHPHNIALKKAQAVRLLKDLESLLRAPAVLLMLAVLVCGCSARIEVDRAKTTDVTATEISGTEVGRTAVEVDFQPRSPQPVSQREPPPVPVTVPPEPQPVTITNNTVVLNYRGGDVTYHSDTHIHVHEPVQRHVEETVVIRREVQAEPRPVDPRCEQLRREHDERVRRWKAFPLGQ